jgi:hypothetical protein
LKKEAKPKEKKKKKFILNLLETHLQQRTKTLKPSNLKRNVIGLMYELEKHLKNNFFVALDLV